MEDIVCHQIFNRRSVGFLWDKRAELDPGQVSIINSIYNNKKKGSIVAQQEITYKLSRSNAGKLGYGRLYGSKGSFETLEKECRGTICKEYYHDIDIVNCHPVILVQFALKKFKAVLPEVEKYVDNREAFLKNVMTENSVTRDEAKQAIISVLYGGTCNQQSFLYELSQEVRGFSKKLFQTDEYSDLAKAVKSEKNIYGSFLSYILQTEERKCMLAMKDHLESCGWSIDVLCYDGVMVRRREGFNYDLKACEDAVASVTGYKINLVSKEFSSFDMPSLSEEIVKGVSLDAYKEMKDEFEQMNFYHGPSDKYVKIYNNCEALFMTLTHATEVFSKEWIFVHSSKFADYTSFFPIWRKDSTRRVCDTMTFKPSTDPRVFSIPINFAYTRDLYGPKIAPENLPFTPLELFLELIDINTTGDTILKEYMLNYFAHMLQKPTELPGVALVISGSKGTGKDTLGDFLQEWVVGRSLSTNYVTNTQFFDKHDTGKLNKFLIKLEETSKKDCFENASQLKASITAHQITCNPKGIKEITADNFARYIFTTNKANPVDMSDKERRFVLFRCSYKKQNNFEFWTHVRNILFTPYGGREVAYYLLQRDISQFEIRTLPVNNYQASIIQSEKSSEETFLEAWEGVRTSASDMYKEYIAFCISNHLPYAQDASWFGKKIQPFVRDGKIVFSNCGGVSYYYKLG
jgi:hypothetical protein